MLKDGDFVKIEYTGYDKNGVVFDATEGKIAKKLRNKDGPILVVYGRGQLIHGLEEKIKDMKTGEEKEVELTPEKAFGKKKKDLFNIMREGEFKKYEVIPRPGLTVHVDFENKRIFGLIKSVNSGRVLVDFNHPLAGQTIRYKVKILDIMDSVEKKVDALIGETSLECTKTLKNGKLTLSFKENKDMKKEEFELKKNGLLNAIKHFVSEVKETEVTK